MKISNKVFRLKVDFQLSPNILIPKGKEIEVVRDVIYMDGYPLYLAYQKTFLDWILANPNSLSNETKMY